MSIVSRIFRAILPLALLVALVGFPSCEEEGGDMEAVVVVKYLGDTTQLVPGANVVISKNDIHVDGVTDSKGEFSYVFELEAILDIHVTKDTGTILTGASVIRLKPGKTVYRTVYIGQ
jgi:hypothetical protein